MAKKLNGTWKVIGLVVTLLLLFASVVTTWAIYGRDIEETKEHVVVIEVVQQRHEDRLDACDVFKAEFAKDIKYMSEGMTEQKALSKEILEEIKELRK